MTATASTPVAGRGHTGRVVLMSATAALGGFLFGFDTAVINGAVDAIRSYFHMDSFATGTVVAAALLGSAAGAWLAGPVADRYGRIRTMLTAALLFAVSALGAGLAVDPWTFTVFRVIGGAGVGVASVVAPAYIAEVAPARIRGRLGSLQQLAIVTGIFVALLADALFSFVAGGSSAELWLGAAAWRWMFLTALLPAICYAALAARIPESPRFLMARNRLDEARDVLAQIMDPAEATAKMAEIKASFTAGQAGLSGLRRGKFGLLPVVWVGIGLSVFQQFVGINVIFYYSSTLWQSVGFSEHDSLTITVITSVVNIATTLIAIALIDRIGRRRLLLIGSVAMAITLGVLTSLFFAAPVVGGHPQLTGAAGPVALVAANLFVVAFGMSWGPVVWVLLGEMFSNRIRAVALAVGAAAQWVANFAVTLTFPPLAGAGVGIPYLLYTIFAIASAGFVARYVRETKGRELETM